MAIKNPKNATEHVHLLEILEKSAFKKYHYRGLDVFYNVLTNNNLVKENFFFSLNVNLYKIRYN